MVRSHAIWPYPIMWGLILFTLSIFYFLKFKNVRTQENKFFYISVIFLVISSYIITFSVFGIYYLIYFLKNNKLNFSFIKFILFIIIISLPAIWFIFLEMVFIFLRAPKVLIELIMIYLIYLIKLQLYQQLCFFI